MASLLDVRGGPIASEFRGHVRDGRFVLRSADPARRHPGLVRFSGTVAPADAGCTVTVDAQPVGIGSVTLGALAVAAIDAASPHASWLGAGAIVVVGVGIGAALVAQGRGEAEAGIARFAEVLRVTGA